MATHKPTLAAIFPVIAFLIFSLGAHAQVPRSSYTQTEEKLIKEAARNTLENFMGFLNFCTVPDQPQDDIDQVAELKFLGSDRIFFTATFEVDDDTDPDNSVHAQHPTNIKYYLRQFGKSVSREEEKPIRYFITQISDIYGGQLNNYVEVYFTQTMEAVTADASKTKLPQKRLKVADMQIVEQAGRFKLLISAIDFANRPRTIETRKIPISGKGVTADAEQSAMSPAYYAAKLQKGIRFAADNNFVEAHYSLREASGGAPEVQAKASSELNKLTDKMRRQNYDPSSDLYNGLMERGEMLSARHRYEEARAYFKYALDVSPNKSSAVTKAIGANNEKIARERPLFALLEKESFAEARKEFEEALKDDEKNPNLLLGLARAYAEVGNYRAAETHFINAIKADPKKPETHLWWARTLAQSRMYNKAYDAYVKYKTVAEENAEPNTDGYIAYLRGMDHLNKSEISAALDSFQKADIPEAYIALGEAYIRQRNYDAAEKLVENLLKKNPENGPAHFLKGRLALLTPTPGNPEKSKWDAIEAYQTALKHDGKNYSWYCDLADVQTTLKQYNDAIKSYNAYLAKNPTAYAVYYARGKCYYLAGGRLQEAFNDFKLYRDSSGLQSRAFNVDFARVLIQMNEYNQARENLQKAGSDKEAMLTMGVLSYLEHPESEEYLTYFERAFMQGVSRESVGSDAYVKKLYQNNRKFKSLVKKYNYSSVL